MSKKEKIYYQGCKGVVKPDNILAHFEDGKKYIIEEKYDGIWCAVKFNEKGKVTLISRNGLVKDNEQLKSLIKELEKLKLKNSILVGELAFGSNAGTTWAKKNGGHKIDIFDFLVDNNKDLTAIKILKRKEMLSKVLKKVKSKFIVLAPMYLGTKKDIKRAFLKVIARNGEGIVVKDLDSGYKFNSKTPKWYKVKKEVEEDYVILGFTETNSKEYADKKWIGAIECGLYKSGKLEKVMQVGSMTNEIREYASKNKKKILGKVITVKGFEKFKSGALRHPSIFSNELKYFIRTDKDAKDCIL